MRSALKRSNLLWIFFFVLAALVPARVMGTTTGDGQNPKGGQAKAAEQSGHGSGDPAVTSKTNSLEWSIDPPTTTWNLTHNDAIEFVVTVASSSAIKSLEITHSTVADSDSDRGVALPAKNFGICPSPDTPFERCNGVLVPPQPQSSLSIAPAESDQPQSFKNTLWIKIAPGVVPNGTFTGNLTLDTTPLTDSKTIALTIQHTSKAAKGTGLALLVSGVVVAWFVIVFAKSRLNRDQALLPVALFEQKLVALGSRLTAVPSTFKSDLKLTPSRIEAVNKTLTIANLDAQHLLPPRIPGWTQSSDTQGTAYQTFLQQTSQLIEDLDVLVSGIETAASFLPTTPADQMGHLHLLVASIDALSGTLPQNADALRTQVKALISNYGGGLQSKTLELAIQRLSPSPTSPELTPIRINIQIEGITLLYWGVWGILSVIVGFTLLVESVPGFGVFADYVRCCLWGFGLPVAGQGLQQLTMASVNTQLGVNFPK